jgi:hypothetical protein
VPDSGLILFGFSGKKFEKMYPGRGCEGTTSQTNELEEHDKLRAQLAKLEKEEQISVQEAAVTGGNVDTESKILDILSQFDNAAVSLLRLVSLNLHLY